MNGKIKYLPIHLNETEKMDIADLARTNLSFYRVWKNKIDLTQTLIDELKKILYGPIPRNFVINIKGQIGRQTGVFKTAFASQLALSLDPDFNIVERLAFTPYQLLEKVKMYAKRRQVFMLDERVRDFKMSGEQQLANIVESCRERQLCFVMCGVPEQHITFSDYHLERLGESTDDHLKTKVMVNNEEVLSGPKTVYFLIKKITENKKIYRGYLRWNITQLKDKKWNKFWSEYMILKREHQQKAVESSLTGFDFQRQSKFVMSHKDFKNCINGNNELIKGGLKNLIYLLFPDNTNEERKMIYNQVLLDYQAVINESNGKKEQENIDNEQSEIDFTDDNQE